MSDNEFDDDAQEPPEPPAENHDLRRLREKAKNSDQNAAENEALKRELAFTKAGIDPDDERMGYFVRGYTGDMTAPAIKEAATAAGFLGSSSQSDQGMSEAERAAFTAASQAAAGGSSESPAEDIYAEFRNQNSLRSGVSPEQFAIQIAQKLEQNGGEVRYDGPFREWKGDTGIIPRPGTPLPRRI